MAGQGKVNILLDNCSIHKAAQTRDLAKRLNMDILWNVPYRPDMNGIELVWAIIKKEYKSLMLQRMAGLTQMTMAECVNKAMQSVTAEQIEKCCRHGLDIMMNAEL